MTPTLVVLVEARIAAAAAHTRAVNEWHAARREPDVRTKLAALRDAMQADDRARVALDDAIAEAARGLT